MPLREDLADYASSMGFAVSTLAQVEHRNQDAVYADLSTAGADVAVRAALIKHKTDRQRTDEELNLAVRQIVSGAIASDEVVDIFAAAGLKKPDISILSDEFLAEIRGMQRRNLAVEPLGKSANGSGETWRRGGRSPNAGGRATALSKSRGGNGAGDRGADRDGQAGGKRAWRSAGPE